MLSIYKVRGNSMLPHFAAGDFVIACRLFFSLNIGDCVIVKHANYRCIIKRIDNICPHKGIWLKGDYEDSVSPEQMGWIQKKDIIARVAFCIRSTAS